jgi:hypothetical protein
LAGIECRMEGPEREMAWKERPKGIGDNAEHGRVEGGKGCDSRGRKGPDDGGKDLARRLTTEERR